MSYGEDTPASPGSSVTRGDSVVEEERPQAAAPEDEIQGMQKRKSGTFWRRKSNLSLSGAFTVVNGRETQPQNAGSNGTSAGATGGGNTDGGQNGMTIGRHEGEEDATMEDLDTEKPLPEPLSPRSYSPPPQLPAFVGGGGGLGGEDMFKDIQ